MAVRTLLLVFAIFWFADALFTLGELVNHLLAGTSSVRSQILRLVSGLFFMVMSAGLVWRYPGWKFVAGVGAAMEGFRNYALLAVPLEIDWNVSTIFSAVSVFAAVCTLVLCLVSNKRPT